MTGSRCRRGALPHLDHRGLLTRRGHFIALASVAVVGVLALALTAVPWLTGHRVVQRILQEGQDEAAQITLRGAMVLLFVLLAVASRFGLDVVLGAMLAGMVLRGWARRSRMDIAGLERKFDAVGYGIFIPIFFISSGMTLDLKAIARDPLRLLIFFAASLVQANGRGWSFQPSVNAPMAAVSWRTEVNEPRRMAWRVITEKHSTRLSQEQLAGVKCRVIRWFSGRASQVRTSGCLQLASLPSTTCRATPGQAAAVFFRNFKNSWWRWRG
jgi:hypothetical protein